MHEVPNLMIRIVTLATCSIALIVAFPVTPVVAAGGKATHAPKAKKAKQSLFDDPAFAHGYRAAYSAVYDRTCRVTAVEHQRGAVELSAASRRCRVGAARGTTARCAGASSRSRQGARSAPVHKPPVRGRSSAT